jgi:diguanylate cyclase (GGDEF)-like protein
MRTHKVLLMHGHGSSAGALRGRLEAEGLDIEEVDFGPAAIECADKWRPHVAIVHYSPHDAYLRDVLCAIRANDRDLRLVLVTEAALDSETQSFLHGLEVEAVVHPFQPADRLTFWLRSALRSYELRVDARRRQEGLRRLLDTLARTHQTTSAEELLRNLVRSLEEVFGGSHRAFAALAHRRGNSRRLELVHPNWSDEQPLRVVATSGVDPVESANDVVMGQLARYLREKKVLQVGSCHFVPLHNGRDALGILGLEHGEECRCDDELLQLVSFGIGQALEIRRLTHLTSEDDLTRVYTRQFFFRMAETAIQNASRDEHPFALAVFDVDFFKSINDTRGHLEGDRVLKDIATLFRTNLRPQDFVGRFGGDEFMVALPRTSGTVAFEVLDRLRRKVENTFADGDRKITISCGVVGIDCLPLEDRKPRVGCCAAARVLHQLVEAADRLLYVSKTRGRNAVTRGDEYDLSVLCARLGIAATERPRVEQRARAASSTGVALAV